MRQLKASGLTYNEFAEKLPKSMIKIVKNAKRIDVKDVERNHRSHGELMLNQILPTSQIIQWNLLLSSNSNKNKLMQFIVNKWKSVDDLLGNIKLYVTYLQEVLRITQNTTKKTHELTSNHQEADKRILLHIQYAFHMKRSLLVLLIQMFF